MDLYLFCFEQDWLVGRYRSYLVCDTTIKEIQAQVEKGRKLLETEADVRADSSE